MSNSKGAIFHPGSLKDQASGVLNAATVIETYVQQVIAQPVVDKLVDVKNLAEHQAAAKSHATEWIANTREYLYQSNSNLLAFCAKFNNFYQPLYTMAADLDTGSNRANFCKGLQLLINDIQSYAQDAQSCAKLLLKWEDDINSDWGNFQSDMRDVNSVYEGDNGAIAGLSKQIDAYNDALNKDLSIMAGGGAAEIVGGLTIAVGLLTDIETAGATTSLIVAGIVVVVGGSTAIGLAAQDYKDTMKQKAEATRKLHTLQSEVAVCQHLHASLKYLASNCTAARLAADGLAKAWQVLATQFQSCLHDLSDVSADDGPFIQGELETSHEDWEKVETTANAIKANLISIPVVVDTSKLYEDVVPAASLAAAARTASKHLFAQLAVTNAAASDQSIGDLVKSLVDVLQYTQADITAMGSGSTVGLEQAVHQQAQQVEALTSRLQSVATQLSDDLQKLVKQNPLNVQAVKDLFNRTTTTLQDIKQAAVSLQNDTATLVQQVVSAVADSSRQVDTISSEIAESNSDIQDLNRKIAELSKQIKKNDAITTGVCIALPVLCPATKALSDLISQRDAKLREEREAAVHGSILHQQLQLLEAKLSSANAFNTAANSLETHAEKIGVLMQLLICNCSSVARDASDELITTWVDAQAQELIYELQQLAGFHSTAPVAPPTPVRFIYELVPTTPPPAVEKPDLAVPGLPSVVDCLSALAAANSDITACADILVQQPNIVLGDTIQFAEQFQLARSHASDWKCQYVTDILGVLSQVSSLSTFARTVLDVVSSQVQRGDIISASSGLQLIQQHVHSCKKISKAHECGVSTFFSVVRDDKSRFVVLSESVPKALNNDIASLYAQIAELQAQIAADNRNIAKGATDTVLKAIGLELGIGVAIAVSFISFPVAAGASELSVLAVKAVNASIEGGSEAAREEAFAEFLKTIGGSDTLHQATQRIETLRQKITQLGREQASLAIFQTVNNQVQQMVTSVASGMTQLANVVAAIDRQAYNCTVLSAEISDKTITAEKVEAEMKEWDQIQAVANQLLVSYAKLALPTK